MPAISMMEKQFLLVFGQSMEPDKGSINYR